MVSWIDNNFITGDTELDKETENELQERFECTDEGEFNEYIGCKVEKGEDYLKLTQPVLYQSLEDEFNLPERKVTTPALAGAILMSCAEDQTVAAKLHRYFRSGVGKLIHVAQWTKPECSNAVRECARHMHAPGEAHIKAMHRVMQYIRDTKNTYGYCITT